MTNESKLTPNGFQVSDLSFSPADVALAKQFGAAFGFEVTCGSEFGRDFINFDFPKPKA
jgi:hypothetical protein